MTLPPGPSEPAAVQTIEWVARPTDLLRRSAARFGEPFTLRTLWADAPMVLLSDPETIKRISAAPPEALRGGASSTVLEPFAGPSSILLTSGAAHMRQRKLMLRRSTATGWRRIVRRSPGSPRPSSAAGGPAGRCGRCRGCRS
jgi:cytochrome P450 family 135